MKINFIESIIDAVNPYFLIKDMGITINEIKPLHVDSNNQDAAKRNAQEGNLYTCNIKQNKIRILPFGYINLSAFDSSRNNNSFIAGTAVDLLAFYFQDNNISTLDAYTKAFKLFFKHYGNELKSKLLHEPVYIEKLVKHNFVRRHNILNFIFSKLSNNETSSDRLCKLWMDKHNIKNLKGYAYCDSSINIYKFLKYCMEPALIDLDLNSIEYNAENYKVYDSSSFGTFINQMLFKDGTTHWIIIPYFSDYHILNAIKFINPISDQYYIVYINNCKLSYAGIYALSPLIDYNTSTIRVIEDLHQGIILQNYNFENILNRNQSYYLIVDTSPGEKTIKSNLCNFHKILFLNQKNSSFQTIKIIYDSLINKDLSESASDLYICDYENYKEDKYVYTYNAFIEKKIKSLIKHSAEYYSDGLSPDLTYFLNIFDINTLSFKKQLFKWLKTNNYINILNRFNSNINYTIAFNKFTISTTNNGYICNYKDKPNETNLLTNFIFKIDQNIIFKNSDEIMHIGRMIMGEGKEYPIIFYKKDLKGKDAIENIALKAYSANENPLFLSNDSYEDNNSVMPVVFDENYNKYLYSVIKHDITSAPCKYGNINVGWDKLNGSYTSLAWQATSLQFNIKSQYIYTLTSRSPEHAACKEIQYAYSNLIPSYSLYSNSMDFLNSGVRDILCVILAYMYRTFLGYPTKIFYIADTVKSRNLIKFIFLALGQIKPIEIPTNTRFLKKNTFFKNLNNYPVYARTSDEDIVKTYLTNYPCILFIKNYHKYDDIYIANQDLTITEYKQSTKFALDTFNRFFKWMFNVNIEEFTLETQECKDNDQLIKEGLIIFKFLWWNDVLKQCKKNFTPDAAFKNLINNMTLNEVYRYIYFAAEKNCYVLRRSTMPVEHSANATIVSRLWVSTKNASYDKEHNYYVYLNKNKVDSLLKDILTKDAQIVNTNEFKIFVSSDMVVDKTWIGQPERAMSKEKFHRIYKNQSYDS